jgi:hypothetical protein
VQREAQWLELLRGPRPIKADALKSLVRKGVPDSLRGVVWPMLCGAAEAKEHVPELYTELVPQRRRRRRRSACVFR